ncbi:MAG: hypothetical protein QOK22_2089 [Gaiellaceae bacterium]|jgi:putative acetyltransferase|nr:hypothetical protein [Gaiellaceae bacterium]
MPLEGPRPQLTQVAAADAALVAAARRLFEEYEESLDVDLGFQGFDEELASLPGNYAGPRGRLLIASVDGEAVGCGALRELDSRTAELKRLYVRPSARGAGIARLLAERLLAEARQLGYLRIRLDTLPAMLAAQRLYISLGFRDIAPYTANPVEGSRFLELTLEVAHTA